MKFKNIIKELDTSLHFPFVKLKCKVNEKNGCEVLTDTFLGLLKGDERENGGLLH